MKNISKILLFLSVLLSSSCAMMFNDKLDDVTIESTPPGADIIIDGINHGQTPRTLRIEPKEYNITLRKRGYGSAQIKTSYWAAMKNKNCAADSGMSMLIIPLYSFQYSGYCNEFKKDKYSAVIPRTESPRVHRSRGNGYYNSRNRGYNYYRN